MKKFSPFIAVAGLPSLTWPPVCLCRPSPVTVASFAGLGCLLGRCAEIGKDHLADVQKLFMAQRPKSLLDCKQNLAQRILARKSSLTGYESAFASPAKGDSGRGRNRANRLRATFGIPAGCGFNTNLQSNRETIRGYFAVVHRAAGQ